MTTSTPAELAESLAAETQVVGGKVHYLQNGAGAPLVLLHHSISNHGWLPLYERLSEKFTVYVPDLPGFGESDRPDWARNVGDIAILIELWMDKLGLSATLAGFGFGGWVAAELSTMSQHRLAGLVLVGASLGCAKPAPAPAGAAPPTTIRAEPRPKTTADRPRARPLASVFEAPALRAPYNDGGVGPTTHGSRGRNRPTRSWTRSRSGKSWTTGMTRRVTGATPPGTGPSF